MGRFYSIVLFLRNFQINKIMIASLPRTSTIKRRSEEGEKSKKMGWRFLRISKIKSLLPLSLVPIISPRITSPYLSAANFNLSISITLSKNLSRYQKPFVELEVVEGHFCILSLLHRDLYVWIVSSIGLIVSRPAPCFSFCFKF